METLIDRHSLGKVARSVGIDTTVKANKMSERLDQSQPAGVPDETGTSTSVTYRIKESS
jgi:hypothetical protein